MPPMTGMNEPARNLVVLSAMPSATGAMAPRITMTPRNSVKNSPRAVVAACRSQIGRCERRKPGRERPPPRAPPRKTAAETRTVRSSWPPASPPSGAADETGGAGDRAHRGQQMVDSRGTSASIKALMSARTPHLRRRGEARHDEDDDHVHDQKSELRGRRRGTGRVVQQGAQDGQHDELSQQAGLRSTSASKKPRQLPEQLAGCSRRPPCGSTMTSRTLRTGSRSRTSSSSPAKISSSGQV